MLPPGETRICGNGLAAGILEPEHPRRLPLAVRNHDIAVAISIYIMADKAHDPTRPVPAMEGPGPELPRPGGRAQPAHTGPPALGPQHQVGPAGAIELHRQGEHPLGLFINRRKGGGLPGLFIEKPASRRGRPMCKDLAIAPLATAHHIDGPISVQIAENRILG